MIEYKEELELQLKELIKNYPPEVIGVKLKSKAFKKLKEYVFQCTSFFSDYSEIKSISLTTRAWFTVNHVKEPFRCEEDNKVLKDQKVDIKTGKHRRFCCTHCSSLNKEVQAILHKTNQERYHCDWSFQSENNKRKTKQTNRLRYNCDYPQQNKDIHNKSDQTREKKYGAKNMMQTKHGIDLAHERTSKRFYSKNLCENQFVIPLFSFEEYLKFGKNDTHLYKWKCLECNQVFEALFSYSWFKQGYVKAYARCSNCYPTQDGRSYEEIGFLKDIQSICPYKVISNARILTGQSDVDRRAKKEIDVYIPEISLGIEFNGIFFHSFEFQGNYTKGQHLRKTILSEDHNIKLIQLRSDLWRNNKEFWKNFFKEIFSGKFDITKYLSQYGQSVIEVDRSIFNKLWEIPGYQLISEIQPVVSKVIAKSKSYHYEDCGKLIYKKI